MSKAQEVAAAILDKEEEPQDNTGKECSNLQLMRGLNFYAARSDTEQLKKYAIIWAEENAPDLLPKIKSAAKYRFPTWGALARLHSRGYKLSQSQLARLRAYFEALPEEEKPPEKVAKPKAKVERVNATLASLDDAIDGLYIQGYVPNVVFDSSDDVNEIILYCKGKLKELEGGDHGIMSQMVKKMRALYEDALTKCATVKTSKKSVGRATKKKPPEVIASKVKFQKEEPSLKLVSIRPHEIIGGKKAYVYDTSRRRLYVFKATESGFTFKGTTLLNVNMSESFFKLVRKPETVIKLTSRPGISDLNKIFSTLTTKETPVPATRFSDTSIIINYS